MVMQEPLSELTNASIYVYIDGSTDKSGAILIACNPSSKSINWRCIQFPVLKAIHNRKHWWHKFPTKGGCKKFCIRFHALLQCLRTWHPTVKNGNCCCFYPFSNMNRPDACRRLLVHNAFTGNWIVNNWPAAHIDTLQTDLKCTLHNKCHAVF